MGSGYFLDRCRFSSEAPSLTLLDLSPAALSFTSHRLRRYAPTARQANVLEPFELDAGPFRSIGLVYLIHCLPGAMAAKSVVFRHLGRYLAPDGVLFGATILGQGVSPPALGRALMRLYNSRGVFGNAADSRELLEQALSEHFAKAHVEIEGSVALFVARGFRG